MAEQRQVHTGGPSTTDPSVPDSTTQSGVRQVKESMAGTDLGQEHLAATRICALLNLALEDMSEPTMRRIMASRNRAIEFHRNRLK
jgi:hypothetical protein